jgi:Zn-dependent protease with chaperone function
LPVVILPATLSWLAAQGGADDSVRNFALALKAFGSGGWIVSFIGAAAMVGRLLIDEAAETHWRRSLKHILAAAIFAIIAFFVTYAWKLSAINKAIIQGLTGALAPELVEWITHSVREKLGLLKPARGSPRRRRKRSSGQKRSRPKSAARKSAAAKPAKPAKKAKPAKPKGA